VQLVTRKSAKQYAVYDPNGALLLQCNEQPNGSAPSKGEMNIYLTDPAGISVLHINRPFAVLKKNASIMDASGKLIGTISKKLTLARTTYVLLNGADQQVCTIQGSVLYGKTRKWSIFNSQGAEMGYLQKEWAGLKKEMTTNANNIMCAFPTNANAETRALLIAASIFIDLSRHEK